VVTTKPDSPALDPDKAIAGVLALLVAEREERLNERNEPRKTEVLLSRAGLSLAEIALITGRKYEAVKKAVSRAAGKG
jgi:DNA-directed RNA polymerase specialized sigma24 family protein